MKLAATVLASLIAAASADALFDTSGGIPLRTDAGSRLLRQATPVDGESFVRQLEQNNNQNSWLATYDIKYLGCSSLIQVSPQGQQGGGGNKNGQQGGGMLYTQQLIRFALCPANSCSSCSGGGEYVVNMAEFIDAYTEAKMQALEQQCESVRENCYCNNYNDDQACETSCYQSAGLYDCIDLQGGNDFEIQRYLECAGKNEDSTEPKV